MELRTDVQADSVTMIKTTTSVQQPPSLEQQPALVRTRKILLILVGILLVLCFINFTFVIHSLASSNSRKDQPPNSTSQLASLLIMAVYYGFGLLVTYRYYQTGLLVFAWLGLASLLLMLAIVIVNLIDIVVKTSHLGFAKGFIVGIIFIVICLAAAVFQILAVRYAFAMSKMLKNTKRLTIEQI